MNDVEEKEETKEEKSGMFEVTEQDLKRISAIMGDVNPVTDLPRIIVVALILGILLGILLGSLVICKYWCFGC